MTAFSINSLAFLLSFITVLWQHLGTATTYALAKALSYDIIDFSVGAGAMALGWVGVGCSGFIVICLLVMIQSNRVMIAARE
jgi:hypothetical protein